ncbi:MAG TPA: amidohydrolase [Solirubrobacteraceae bacterium]
MADTVLKNALVDVGGGVFRRADVAVADGRISTVGDASTQSASETIDCSRAAVVPGMVNAHNHSNENWLRGRFDNLPLEPWMLFSYPALGAPHQSAREIYVRTLLGGLEMVRSGATSVVDFVYEVAGFTEESLEAIVAAYRDLGLRALVVIAMADLAYHETVVLDSNLAPAHLLERLEREKPPAWSEWEAFSRRAVERFHRPEEGIAIGLGPSGPQRCSDEMLSGCAALADELGLAIHIHVLETRMQALSGRRKYGRTLPEHLEAIGFLGPRVSFEHGIWLTDHDIELVAGSGVSVVHNPISNMKLGSGVARVPRLLRAGVNVALGSDGMSSNDGNDMYATLKVAGLLHKHPDVDYHDWLGAKEAWAMATAGGAAPMGDAGLGRLEVGARADLVVLDLDALVFTPLNDPVKHVVFSSTATALRATMVGGRWILRDGSVTGIDEPAILDEARELAQSVLARHDEAFAIGEELLAAVRDGWLEALREDVGMRRVTRSRDGDEPDQATVSPVDELA